MFRKKPREVIGLNDASIEASYSTHVMFMESWLLRVHSMESKISHLQQALTAQQDGRA